MISPGREAPFQEENVMPRISFPVVNSRVAARASRCFFGEPGAAVQGPAAEGRAADGAKPRLLGVTPCKVIRGAAFGALLCAGFFLDGRAMRHIAESGIPPT